VQKGSIQPEVTPLLRLPFYGRERNHWLIKQALDIGADPSRHPGVDAAIQKVVDVCRSSGVPCRTLANKENAAELIRKGYRFLIVPTEREFEAVRIGRGMAR
jgi:2-keto-3-deoxy-L-rhamnonate aldolase RhmA